MVEQARKVEEQEESVLSVSLIIKRKEFVMNIFNSNWAVREMSTAEIVNADEFSIDCDGVTKFNEEVILLNSDRTLHRKGLALTHELLHCLYDSIGVENDEKLVRQIEHGVYEMINSFPKEYKKCGR